jgi:uncharacterized membrane protein SirB2
MNISVIQQIHMWSAILYVISYLYKSTLFLANSRIKYEQYRKATLIPESVLATVFLVSGLYVLFSKGGFSNPYFIPWVHIKFTIVLLAIPVGIVGFKKNNKVLVILSLAAFIAALLLGLINGSSNYL